MFLKDFGMMDEADIRLVIDDSNQKPVWTGGGENLPSPEILAKAKKVLLVIHAGDGITTEELESTLSAFRKLTLNRQHGNPPASEACLSAGPG